MPILYVDATAGIAGDMMVGALMDLGLPLEHLREGLATLHLPGDAYALSICETSRHHLRAKKFSVSVTHDQPHRHYGDILSLIEKSALAVGAKNRALTIFVRLAQAEATVHGVDISAVHFHEVGAMDAIVDIVGTAIGLEYLGIDQLHVSPLPLGGGTITSAHGMLPVPAPATLELLKGFTLHGRLTTGERVTPTGAAIVAALGQPASTPPSMALRAIGCGAGDRDFPDTANILRLLLGDLPPQLASDDVEVLESHIDDMNPETAPYLMERLMTEGALDVALAPLVMKKGRPGWRLTVLSPLEKRQALALIVLTESTAIGLRHYRCSRMMLGRRNEERTTSLGPVQIKVITLPDGRERVTAEFEECRRLAELSGLPLPDIYRLIEQECS
jgi:uncharacterized protein (TIGR00299 family) protein